MECALRHSLEPTTWVLCFWRYSWKFSFSICFMEWCREPLIACILHCDYSTLLTYPAAFTQVMGNAHCRTNIHNDWYKPEGINMTKLTNLTVTCAKRQHTLPECTKHTSPCLFNIKEDPCEFNNIAKQHPELVNNMVKRLHQFAVKKWVDQLVFSTRIFASRAKINLIEFVRWDKIQSLQWASS